MVSEMVLSFVENDRISCNVKIPCLNFHNIHVSYIYIMYMYM